MSRMGKVASKEVPEEAESPRKESGRTKEDIPVDFSSFILSLATSALIHLGEEADPSSGKRSVALPNAKQAIDLITLLKEKTTGNLTKAEENFISQLLYTLRMKFLALEKKRHS
ncbi:DUF1844 domain-containing protein [Nitrospira defluvii]|nr:DUF1844 domain-containing protein [Nitrospira defluvii]